MGFHLISFVIWFAKGVTITFAELNTKSGDSQRFEGPVGDAEEYLQLI